MGRQPNLRKAALRFSQRITLREHTQIVVDGKPVNTYRNFDVMATVQPASPDMLRNILDKVDATKEYIMIHVTDEISANDQVNIGYKFYKIINVSHYGTYGYGFWQAIAEEVKNSGKI